MRIELTRPGDLTEDQVRKWKAVQRGSELLGSPLLSREFANRLGELRSDVEVAIVDEDEETVGFFGFHRDAHNVGHPLGLKLSDLQGAVIAQGTNWHATDLIRQCGLRAWNFDHLISSQAPFRSHHWICAESPFMDLTEGFEEFRRFKQESGSRLLQNLARKKRKMAREVGPVRFEFQCADRQAFDQVLAWKSAQRRRTKTPDVLKFAWVAELLEGLWKEPAPDCYAPLSCLYAGDQLVAGHLGICSDTVIHNWFPAYNPEYSAYSPGLIILLEIAQAAASLGIQRFEFGKGMEAWKQVCKSGSHEVAQGAVDLRPVSRLVHRNWFRTRQWIKASPLRGPAQIPKRFVRHLQNWATMR